MYIISFPCLFIDQLLIVLYIQKKIMDFCGAMYSLHKFSGRAPYDSGGNNKEFVPNAWEANLKARIDESADNWWGNYNIFI